MKSMILTVLMLFSTFFSQSFASTETEMEKINYLIKAVETSGLRFVRNGTSYESADAANHLRQKFTQATTGFFGRHQQITVERFITDIASKSSLSNREYLIQVSDNTFVTAESWLRARLAEYEQSQAGTQIR